MGFVDSDGLRTRWRSILEDILLWRIPEYRIVDRRIRQILGDTFDPSRESIDMLTLRGGHRDLQLALFFDNGTYLDFCIVRNGCLTIDSRKSNRPYSESVPAHWRGLSVLIVYRISKNVAV